MLINLHIFMPPPFNELTASSANHLNFVHKVWDHKRQAKFDLELYQFVHSRITPFDLPKKTQQFLWFLLNNLSSVYGNHFKLKKKCFWPQCNFSFHWIFASDKEHMVYNISDNETSCNISEKRDFEMPCMNWRNRRVYVQYVITKCIQLQHLSCLENIF